MKLHYSQNKVYKTLLYSLIMVLVSSCTIYQSVPNDGIYSPQTRETRVIVRNSSEYQNYEKDYFSNQELERLGIVINDDDVFTDVDEYNSQYDTIQEKYRFENGNYSSNSPWGYNPDSNIVVNINLSNNYNPYWDNYWGLWDPYFANNGFYGPRYWGWNPWLGNSWRWNRWGYGYWGWNNYYPFSRNWYRNNFYSRNNRYNRYASNNRYYGKRRSSTRRATTNTIRRSTTTRRPSSYTLRDRNGRIVKFTNSNTRRRTTTTRRRNSSVNRRKSSTVGRRSSTVNRRSTTTSRRSGSVTRRGSSGRSRGSSRSSGRRGGN